MNRLIKILGALLIVLLIGYLVVMNLPQANIEGKDVEESISAELLYQAFVEDESEAEADYLGKVIRVDGIIDEVYNDENNAPVVVLSSESGEPVSVITLEGSQTEKIQAYKEGDEISIKAMCNGMLMEVTLSKGLIVD